MPVAFAVLFLVNWVAQGFTEWGQFRQEQRAHGQPVLVRDFTGSRPALQLFTGFPVTIQGIVSSRGERGEARATPPGVETCGPEALARYFRVFGDPTRLRIVEALLEGDRSVSELVALVGAPQSRVSNHLACLKWCRVARAERRGRRVVYRITDRRVRALIQRARDLAAQHCWHLASCRRIGPDWI
ncbi:MAG TPA: metalloregulator ArsR/SmtB family transcription factor [Actinomycetota bacterium]|nr:metalloregulator ArsR/SmtB family transcription factor [Actinomycetota bacterium]